MRATGVTKQLDPLGRLLIPKPVRAAINISADDTLEFFVGDEGELIIKKYEIACAFCGAGEELFDFKNRKICKCCIDKITKL